MDVGVLDDAGDLLLRLTIPRADGRSLDGGPGDGRWLASGEEPSSRGGGQGDADDCEDEVEHRYPTQVAEVVEAGRREGEVGCAVPKFGSRARKP